MHADHSRKLTRRDVLATGLAATGALALGRLAEGADTPEPGDTPHPDFALETSWQDWIEISIRGQNPLRAIARRRLRPRGSLRGFRAFVSAFTPRRLN